MTTPTIYGDKPMGMREIRVQPYAGGTIAKLPNAIEMTVEDRVKSAELQGDDAIQDLSSYAEAATIKLSAGGISLDALAVLTGRTPSESGTTPNRVKTAKATAGGQFPYFKAWGRALGTGSDDTWIVVYKCKLTKFAGGSLKNGAYAMSDAEGLAVADGDNGLYDTVPHETATPLPTS